MGLDDSRDLPLEAVAALARAAVNADVGADALAAVYRDPRSIVTLSAAKLPALAIYRESESSALYADGVLVDDIVVAFDYITKSTSLEARERRYPSLQAVWNSIKRAVIAGKHASAEGGAMVLCAAGIASKLKTASVSYAFAEGASESYPVFSGRIALRWIPSDVDASTMDPFLEFYAAYDEPGGDFSDLIANDTVTLAGYGS